MFKAYYMLTKPGIIYGNLLTTAAGFLLAANGDIAVRRLLATLAGTALVIGAACALNNYLDRDIDRKMNRTQKRALATGTISDVQALVFATILGILGFALLAVCTNRLTVLIGLIGFVNYTLVYTLAKRYTKYATLIGSISGATPIAAGYTAAAGTFDLGAALVFLVMVLWQMPHFYAISIFRKKDYAAAGVPVLPLAIGVRKAQLHILFYIAAYIAAASALTVNGITGYTFLLVMTLLSATWLWKGVQGLDAKDQAKWARNMFLYSLIVMLTLSVLLACNWLLP